MFLQHLCGVHCIDASANQFQKWDVTAAADLNFIQNSIFPQAATELQSNSMNRDSTNLKESGIKIVNTIFRTWKDKSQSRKHGGARGVEFCASLIRFCEFGGVLKILQMAARPRAPRVIHGGLLWSDWWSKRCLGDGASVITLAVGWTIIRCCIKIQPFLHDPAHTYIILSILMHLLTILLSYRISKRFDIGQLYGPVNLVKFNKTYTGGKINNAYIKQLSNTSRENLQGILTRGLLYERVSKKFKLLSATIHPLHHFTRNNKKLPSSKPGFKICRTTVCIRTADPFCADRENSLTCTIEYTI